MNLAALSALVKGDIDNARIAATPGGIEAQERGGQAALVASPMMPAEMHPSREAFERSGFVFGDSVDEIFVAATFPAGWSRKATDHAMHSDIFDEQGRRRVGVFYKAAFYDRRANAYLIPRYKAEMAFPGCASGGDPLAEGEHRYVVLDTGRELYRTAPVQRGDWEADRRAEAEAIAWLMERFPRAKDPVAYWDRADSRADPDENEKIGQAAAEVTENGEFP